MEKNNSISKNVIIMEKNNSFSNATPEENLVINNTKKTKRKNEEEKKGGFTKRQKTNIPLAPPPSPTFKFIFTEKTETLPNLQTPSLHFNFNFSIENLIKPEVN